MTDKRMFMPAQTERLLLRPLRAEDAQALAGYRSDPQVAFDVPSDGRADFRSTFGRGHVGILGDSVRATIWSPGEWALVEA